MTLSTDHLAEYVKVPFRYIDAVDSTNDLALEWLQNGAVHGSTIIADEQRKGRGRMGRTWHTPPGVALAVSIILRPDPTGIGDIGLAGAVSVAQLCESLGIAEVSLKWPNDIQIGGKKVCGILPEGIWQDGRLSGVVLGIGVNVRVLFGDDLVQIATSLETETGRSLDRAVLAGRLIDLVMHWSAQLGSDELFSQWRMRLNMRGKTVRVGDVSGIALDVDRSGALLIQQPDGSVQRVLAGDVMLDER